MSQNIPPSINWSKWFTTDEDTVKAQANDEIKIKVTSTPENEQQVLLDQLHELAMAYKLSFNPNRLIDAAMVLKQRLVTKPMPKQNQLNKFQQEMVRLYHHLTTTECLDLYGYFANNDSRYLLYTLFIIAKGAVFDWLPELTKQEKAAIANVFEVLDCVMEALRTELKNRPVKTENYVYRLTEQSTQVEQRHRDTVLRVIEIYGRNDVMTSDELEQSFHYVEGKGKDNSEPAL